MDNSALRCNGNARHAAGFALLIIIVVGLAFSPCLSNGFLDWDDDLVFTDNPHIQGLTVENVKWAFSSFHVLTIIR